MKNELRPTSNEDYIIGEDYISQVRTFGALGYSVDRICNLLRLSKNKKIALGIRMSIPGDTYHTAYIEGKALGEYNIDAELAKKAESGEIDAITALETRKNERVELELRHKLFGI